MAGRALLPLLFFVACGLCDAGIGLVARDGRSPVAAEVLALLPVAALWALAGAAVWAVFALVLRLCLAPVSRASLRTGLRDFLPQLWRARRTRGSRRLAAAVIGNLTGLACFLASSVLVGIELITHRHGAELIALSLVAAQLALGFVSVLVGLVVRRFFLATADLLATRLHASILVSAPVVLGSILLLTLVAGTVAAARFAETLLAVDAGAFALACVSLLGFVVVWSRVERAPGLSLAAALTVAVMVLLAGLRSPQARGFASEQTLVAKYMLAELRDASDFDKDGAPWFPLGEDCAPFDAARHPFVLERPHNGIDENCDGADDFPLDLVKPRRRATPSRTIEPKPNLVLITMDATRADHMGFMGYRKHETTPVLDAFAKKSTIFTSAFSADSGTGPSTWSLMSGRTPFQASIASAARFPFSLGPEETTLAEHLSRAGYQTSAALCGSMFASKHWNIRRGFAQYAEVCGSRVNEVADRTASEAIERLSRLGSDRPFFFWVHLLDPHHPYTDHKDLRFGHTPIDCYDEEIRATDAAIGRILAALQALPAGRATYVAVSADHGENFGEHGRDPHARTLYREVTNVPLVISGPGVVARRVAAPVASGDLYPTFLELAGVEVPERCTMTSQFNVLFGAEPDRTRLVFQENSFSRPVRHVKAVVSDQHHLLFDTSNHVLELYAWRKDPKERLNLYGTGEADENRLRQALLVFLSTTTLPAELKH